MKFSGPDAFGWKMAKANKNAGNPDVGAVVIFDDVSQHRLMLGYAHETRRTTNSSMLGGRRRAFRVLHRQDSLRA
jgi:hypothetical protein